MKALVWCASFQLMRHQAVAPRGDDYAHALTHTLVSSFSSISHVGFNEGSLGHRSALSHRQFPHMHLDGHAHTELIEQSHTPSASMLKCTETSISAESVGKDANTWNRMAVSDTILQGLWTQDYSLYSANSELHRLFFVQPLNVL